MATNANFTHLWVAAFWLSVMCAVTPGNLLAADTSPTLRLKVAGYNIHGGVGSDRRFDLQRVARVLKVAAPDVVGLNEVYNYPGATPQHEALARELGDEWVAFFGKTIDKPGSEYGNAILTRLPVESTQNWLLDEWPRQEQRGLMRVTVRKDGHRVHVFCTHMGLASTMREKNARQLIDILDQFNDAQQVLVGDFNEVPPAPGLELLAKSGYTDAWEVYGLGPGKTFPARPALRRLDYIWLTDGLAAESVYVGAFAEAKVASDHRPIFASIVTNPRNRERVAASAQAGEIIFLEDLEKVPATERPGWWTRLKNVRDRGDADGIGAVEVVGEEHFWRQKSEGELVFGEEKSRLPPEDHAGNGTRKAVAVSARIQMLSPGAGWQISHGDVALRVRHDRGSLPLLDLLHRDKVIKSEEMYKLGSDPYVWNLYAFLVQPSGLITVFINGKEAVSHPGATGCDADSLAGFRITTNGGAGVCEILADDLALRTFDSHNVDAVVLQRQQVPPKIIRASGRPALRWWNNLW